MVSDSRLLGKQIQKDRLGSDSLGQYYYLMFDTRELLWFVITLSQLPFQFCLSVFACPEVEYGHLALGRSGNIF